MNRIEAEHRRTAQYADARGRHRARVMQIHHGDPSAIVGPDTGSRRAPWALVGSFIGAVHGLIAIVLGVAVAGLLWVSIDEASPPEDGIITTAVVVGSVEGSVLIDNVSHTTFSPIYEYQDTSGATHRVTDRISPGENPPVVGSTVEVSYVEGDPESVRRTGLVSDWMHWMFRGGIVVAAGGLLLTGGSLAAGARSIRRRRRTSPVGGSPFVT